MLQISSCLSHFNLCGVNMMHTYTSIFTCVLWTIDRLLGHSNLMWLCFIFLVHHIWFRQKSLIFIFQVPGLASICIWHVGIHFYWISQCWVDLISTEGALRPPTTYDNHPIRPSTKPLYSSKEALDWSKSTSNYLQSMTTATFWQLSDNILTTFWQHSDNILTTFWLHSNYILATFWLHSDILARFWPRSDYILITVWLISDQTRSSKDE